MSTTKVAVTVIGPNIPGNQAETFHVHAAFCADLAKPRYRITERSDGLLYDSLQAIVEDWYGDMIAENEPGDDWATWEPYASDFKVFPCVKGLPNERPTVEGSNGPCGESTDHVH